MKTVLEYLGIRRTSSSIPFHKLPFKLQVVFAVTLMGAIKALSVLLP